ncbi:transmembrane protein 92-like [Cricetulus griseus]|uniref:transmembrane protein 92-like n=1 Tax=Cricetulus griseus TaxID=10029 RepID=UPI0015C33D1F|nr:transmembrane protein 92-like [Cricetulus griseus]
MELEGGRVTAKCDTLTCPKGFRCCESGCCLQKETIWDSSKQPEQNRRSHHQTPPEAPTTAPLEIWVTSLDPPPPYDQVSLSVPILNLFHSWLSNL